MKNAERIFLMKQNNSLRGNHLRINEKTQSFYILSGANHVNC